MTYQEDFTLQTEYLEQIGEQGISDARTDPDPGECSHAS
jgi:hypothetical protein